MKILYFGGEFLTFLFPNTPQCSDIVLELENVTLACLYCYKKHYRLPFILRLECRILKVWLMKGSIWEKKDECYVGFLCKFTVRLWCFAYHYFVL